jgi:hypothetical protein
VSGVQAVTRFATVAVGGSDEHTIELRLEFSELDLIHRSLEAVRILGLVERQDGLLTDTLQLIDVALEEAR